MKTPGKKTVLRWLCIVGLVAVVAAGLAHRPILSAMAGGLIVDQGPAPNGAHIVIFDGDKRFDVAAELFNNDPSRKILHLGSGYSRLVEYGVSTSSEESLKIQLRQRGVPQKVIEFLGVDLGSLSNHADANTNRKLRTLNRWLGENANTFVVVICDRFDSRRLRYQIDKILSPEAGRRVFLLALTDRRFSENDWWRSRRGVKQFGKAWVDLGATWWFGLDNQEEDLPRWDPDQYEAALRRH